MPDKCWSCGREATPDNPLTKKGSDTTCLFCREDHAAEQERINDAVEHLLWGGLFANGLVDDALQKATDVLNFLNTLKVATYEAHENADPKLAERLWAVVKDVQNGADCFAKVRELDGAVREAEASR